jgi:glycosyltransferase involved in cell wall biosynthesis
MKNILYACMQMPWPLDNGQKIVSFNDLKYLSRRFQIDVISYIDPVNLSRRAEYLECLRERLPTVSFLDPIPHHILRERLKDKVLPFIRGIINALPYVVSKYWNRSYLEVVKNSLSRKEYDVLYIESLGTSYVVNEVLPIVRGRTKTIYRAFDVFSETLSSYSGELSISLTGLAVKIDLRVCKSYERRLWDSVDLIFPVTRRLGSLMTNQASRIEGKIFYFPVFIRPIDNPPQPRGGFKRVLYIGTVHYPPNLLGLEWFLNKCWPLVLRKYPEATLNVVGRGGDQLLPVPSSVRIHNYLDDLSAAYEGADVFIVPLFSGSGIRLKILDALNHGVPVVSTPTGYAGLELVEGRDILVADDHQGFANHICSLIGSRERREQLSRNGRRFLEANHDPKLADQIIERILQLVEK